MTCGAIEGRLGSRVVPVVWKIARGQDQGRRHRGCLGSRAPLGYPNTLSPPPPRFRSFFNNNPLVLALPDLAMAPSYGSFPTTGPRAHFFFCGDAPGRDTPCTSKRTYISPGHSGHEISYINLTNK